MLTLDDLLASGFTKNGDLYSKKFNKGITLVIRPLVPVGIYEVMVTIRGTLHSLFTGFLSGMEDLKTVLKRFDGI